MCNVSAQLADDGVRVAAASLTGVLPNQHGTDGGAKTSQFRKGLRRHLTIPAANRPRRGLHLGTLDRWS